MVRHKVYTRVSTFDTDGNVIREDIRVGGRKAVHASEVIFNTDDKHGKNRKAIVRVEVDEEDQTTVSVSTPTNMKVHQFITE